MSIVDKSAKATLLLGSFGAAAFLTFQLHLRGDGLWEGLSPAVAASPTAPAARSPAPYDLTQLRVVNEVLKAVRDRYVDPKRVKPREMLLSALNYVQRDVAQVIVLHEDTAPTVRVRVDNQEREFRVDNVQGPWDVSARLREVFAFLQEGLKGSEVDLREVEYAACNGMLHTLDPHSVLMSPEAYKEMNLSTSGQFGGLGIVISIRDQQLTVINPIPGTPAGRAGIKKYDRITNIDNESTLNMGLNEAVNHLRGTPGTQVAVGIHRDGPNGWLDTKIFDLTREVIRVASLEHKMLDGNIGYIRLKGFQANTSSDLDAALTALRKGEFKGLVLDLRGNPGGLVEQAARVVDKFINEGPILATVGNPSEGRDEKTARPEGTEPNYPIVLIVNGTSASASEIVAGAMKNHDRAVIIGETTFGKGSVQLIFNDLPDKAALKLTIAQYLTMPGDISIQGTGVTPDIELDPMTADLQEMDLTVDTGMIKERDLSRSLSNSRVKEGQRPIETVRYHLSAKERQALRDRGGDPDDQFALDFPIRFARDLVARATPGKRSEQLRSAKAMINETRANELAKVSADLKKLGIDWSDAPVDVASLPTPTAPAGIEVKIETDRPQNEVTAGEPINLRVTVTNKGTTTLHRLKAVTKSDNPYFDNKELAFGKLEPGKSRTTTAPLGWCEIEGYKPLSTAPLPKDAPRVCKVPRDLLSRADGVTLHFDEARNRAPADATATVSVRSLERPVFSYNYQIVDNRKGNGDGRAQKGEALTMYLTIKNIGRGRAYETQTNLRNLSGDGLLLKEGRFDISNMQPGEVKRVAFTFDIQPQLAESAAKVELSIVDRDLRESVVEKIQIPIVEPVAVAPATGAMRARPSGANLLQSPDPMGRAFGHLAAGTVAPQVGTTGGFAKLNLGSGRFGFAAIGDLEPANGASTETVTFQEGMAHAPPTLEVSVSELVTREPSITLKVLATDDTRLLDAFVFVGTKKFFYLSNRNAPNPKKIAFETNVPLRPGSNVITIVARENPETTTRRALIVRRDGPNGELLATPKLEDDLSETAGAVDDD